MKITLVGVVSFAAGFMTAAVFAAHTHQQKLDEQIEEIKADYRASLESEWEKIEIEREKLQSEKAEEEFRSKPENQVVEGPDGPTYADQLGKGDEVEIEGTTYELLEEVQDVTVEAAQELIEHQGYTAYNKIAEKPKGPTVSTPAIPEIPVKITFEEFDLTPKDYEQYVLTYHMGNNKLVSQAGKVIEGKDLIRTVGDLLGTFEDGKDAIYIRNPKLKMDFEVVRVPTSHEDE